MRRKRFFADSAAISTPNLNSKIVAVRYEGKKETEYIKCSITRIVGEGRFAEEIYFDNMEQVRDLARLLNKYLERIKR